MGLRMALRDCVGSFIQCDSVVALVSRNVQAPRAAETAHTRFV